MARPLKVVIVGAGFGGMATAIELRKHGISDITILDRAQGLGGTWFHNTYPGAACDVPSHLYSYSFAQRTDWTRICSPQQEILGYLERVADEFGLRPLIRLGCEVEALAYDDAARRWTVSIAGQEDLECDAVVVATGQLHRKLLPNIPGRDSFAGHSFHSAEWDHGYDLRGKRVAVVGTGASAVQFVPEIAKEAAQLDVYQRSGNWFLPRRSRPYPAPLKWAFAHVPGLQAFRRRFIYHYGEFLTYMIRHPKTAGRLGAVYSATFMRRQLKDPEVRAKAWPDYTFGCKRVIFSSLYLPALQRPNVELVSDAIVEMTPQGPKTADGRVREVDCVIYGTGFRTTDFMFPMEITGAGGRSLREAWDGGAHAHLGITVPGFPSLFLMYGPNTNTSGGSIIVYLEAQAAYIRSALTLIRDRELAAIDVRPDVEAAFDREVQSRFAGTAWTRCDSWYRNESGRVVANWPGYMGEYVQATAAVDPTEFELLELPERAASVG